MKITFSGIVMAAVLAMPAVADTNFGYAASVADLTGAPAERPRDNVNYEKYETRSTSRTYSTTTAPRTTTYTTQPTSRGQLYRSYDRSGTTSRTATTTRSQTVRSEMRRKYYLAHPFFQPTEGKFGLISDFSYNQAGYDVAFTPNGYISSEDAKWSMDQFAIKEDLSFGITDRVGVLAMARYDTTKSKFEWENDTENSMRTSGINIFGLGLQWRFVDTSDWIAMLTAAYERQKDIANEYVLDLKAGYKIAKSTIYGVARGWVVDFDDNMYVNSIEGNIGDTDTLGDLMIAYDDDVDVSFFFEGGLGVFSVLGEDWTLNLEALFGHYEWHNQASIRGAFGWQPNDWFALNLYAKTSFYDTAEEKSLKYFGTDAATGEFLEMGKAKLDRYNETSFGAQVIFYF